MTPPEVGSPVAAEALPRDAGRPFDEPWQARAFALTHQLVAQGVFTWPEHAAALGAAIRQARTAGDSDRGDTYWQHYLAALEELLKAKGVA